MRIRVWMILMAGLGAWGQTPPAHTAPAQYSAESLYNLGNAYARDGKPGLAVLQYKRALLLAPGDPDIRANLSVVRARSQVSAEPRSSVQSAVETVSPALAAWIGVAGVVLIGTAFLAMKRWPGRRGWLAGGVPAGAALIAFTVWHAVLLQPRLHEAVVLIPDAPARVAPVPMGEAAFVLKEAETVTMTAEHEDFILVRTAGGRSGWVARVQLGSVVPREAGAP